MGSIADVCRSVPEKVCCAKVQGLIRAQHLSWSASARAYHSSVEEWLSFARPRCPQSVPNQRGFRTARGAKSGHVESRRIRARAPIRMTALLSLPIATGVVADAVAGVESAIAGRNRRFSRSHTKCGLKQSSAAVCPGTPRESTPSSLKSAFDECMAKSWVQTRFRVESARTCCGLAASSETEADPCTTVPAARIVYFSSSW